MSYLIKTLSPILALNLLLACQPVVSPTAGPQSTTQPGAQPASRPFTVPLPPPGAAQAATARPKLTQAARLTLESLSARVESAPHQDRLVIKLPARKGFATLALGGGGGSDGSELAYLRVWVEGPGLTRPYFSSAGYIDLSGGLPAEVTVEDVPKGKNRVLVAQFYDAAQNPLDYAVAMSVYNSGTGSTGLSIRRQFLPLGRVILRLRQIAPLLATGLDTAALKSLLDPVFYGANAIDGNTYALDPALYNATALAQAIFAAQGNLAAVDVNSAAFKVQKASLSLNVSKIGPGDQISVSVGDPFSQAATLSADGIVTVTGIAPGTWPVTVSSSKSEYPTATINGVSKPVTLTSGGAKAVLGTRSFVTNQVTSGGNLVLETDLDLDPLSVSFSRSGRALGFTGTGFDPIPGNNTVTFTHSVTLANTDASSFNSGDFEHLSVDVPSLPAGIYSVSVNGVAAGNLVVNVWTVTPTGSNSNQGLGWNDATSLGLALVQCAAGDEIWLKAGTYKPDPSLRDAYFQSGRTVTLRGGFNGVAINGSRDPIANPVILSGDLNNDDAAGVPIAADPSRDDNSYHVLRANSDLTLDGLTIRGGYAVSSGSNPLGGALLMAGSGYTLTLTDVVFDRNFSSDAGGAVYLGAGNTLSGSGVSFTQNRSQGPGGAAYLAGGTVSLSQFAFSGNQSQLNGGGLAIDGGTQLTLSAGQFIGNQALNGNEAGGGAYLNQTPYSFDQLLFQNNTTPGEGGALSILNSSGSINRSSFSNNQAALGGGISHYPNTTGATSSLTVTNSSFSNNSAMTGTGGGQGGAIDSQVSDLILINSVFAGNTSDNIGGAILSSSFGAEPGILNLRHCTLYDNDGKHGADAGSSGQGDSIYVSNIDVFRIDNSILWDNESFPHSQEVYVPGTTPVRVINNSLIMDLGALTLTGTSNTVDADPLFVGPATPAGSNGFFGDTDDGLRIPITSPAVDRGLAVGVPLDYLGLTRTGPPDAGAYEFKP